MNIIKLEDCLQIESIRYSQSSIEALNYCATRFVLTVPFGSIGVQNGKPISAGVSTLFNKIVHDKRGGFYYKLNTFFKAYLQQKGFNPGLMSATIRTPGDDRSQNGSHAPPVVSINNVFYVADVGFGDLSLNAIPITLPGDTQQTADVSETFRAIFNSEDKGIFYVQRCKNNHWHIKCEAEFKARKIEEFDQNIEYNQTHPDSVFVKHSLITMPQSFGRATISENHLTSTKDGTPGRLTITKDNYRQFLTKYFGLDVTTSRLEDSDS